MALIVYLLLLLLGLVYMVVLVQVVMGRNRLDDGGGIQTKAGGWL